MILTDIVERHAQQAAFLWHQRDAAVRSPAYDLDALERLDDRVEANLDGLRIAGDRGWEICSAALAQPGGGEVFAATVLAVEREDVRSFAKVLALCARSPELSRALVSALGWVPFERVKRYLGELLENDAPPEIQYFGVAGAAVHRYDPGEALAYAARSDDTRLRSRALRALGELGRTDLLSALRHGFEAEDERCRFWAMWSGALLGERAAIDALWRASSWDGLWAERACCMAARCGEPALSIQRILEVAGRGALRAALAGAAALGAPSAVPFVIDCMQSREHARFAGWAFTMITGAALLGEKLAGPKPEGFRAGPTDSPRDPDVTPDRDASLPWPDVGTIRSWWERNGSQFSAHRSMRLLLGKPLEDSWLSRVLRSEGQPAREAAAIELAAKSKGRSLFEVRAPGFKQRQLLS
jgi:uncharacterized protein (TIGR02270 family)